IWPCHLRKVGGSFQVTKKIKGVQMHIVRLMLEARDDELVKFSNGDTLDYTGDNPYVVCSRRGAIVSSRGGEDLDAQQVFERSNLFRAGWDTSRMTTDWTPAVAKRPHGPGIDGSESESTVISKKAADHDLKMTWEWGADGIGNGSLESRGSKRDSRRLI